MNEKFNKNAKVEQLTKVVLSHWEEKGLIVKDPSFFLLSNIVVWGPYNVIFRTINYGRWNIVIVALLFWQLFLGRSVIFNNLHALLPLDYILHFNFVGSMVYLDTWYFVPEVPSWDSWHLTCYMMNVHWCIESLGLRLQYINIINNCQNRNCRNSCSNF